MNSTAFCNRVLQGSARFSLRLHDFAFVHGNASTVDAYSVIVELDGFVKPEVTRKTEAAANC